MKADSKIDSKISEKVLSLAVPGEQKRALNALRWTQKTPGGQATPTIHIGTKTVKHNTQKHLRLCFTICSHVIAFCFIQQLLSLLSGQRLYLISLSHILVNVVLKHHDAGYWQSGPFYRSILHL